VLFTPAVEPRLPTRRATDRRRLQLLSVPVRLVLAVLALGYHLASVMSVAHDPYGESHFNAAPGAAPHYRDLADVTGVNVMRLLVVRWDAPQYVSLAVRGYEPCPRGHIDVRKLSFLSQTCILSFYPGYPLMGRAVAAVTKLPIDYALWTVSLVASFLFLFLWTDPAIVRGLGPWTTLLSFVAFNAFPTSCYLVFVMTEPCTLLFTLCAVLGIAKKQYAFGALAAGAASAMRITGGATSIAYVMALAAVVLTERPRGRALLRLIACAPLAGWGGLAIMGYFWSRFGDPLLYIHAHGQAYEVTGSLAAVLAPKPVWLMHALDGANHDLVWGFGVVIWFLLGHRLALSRFSVPMQVCAYALVALTLWLSYAGSIEIYMRGFARYVLVAIPLFYAIAAFLRTRPLVLTLWLVACVWHYRHVDMCIYLGHVGPNALRKCNLTQWIDW
jgi:hypothetical protein